MTETNVFELTRPGTFSDPLTEVLRNGARTLLGQAVEAEVAAWLSTHTDKLTDDGRRRLVRHGHLPERRQQSKAKRALQEIWMAETKKDALAAFDAFIETWGVKYDKAVECLIKDRDALLAFYDFPAEHWKHLRTTNPIESSFATVRHRTVRSKGCLSNKTALAMIFKLAEAAEKNWRRLDGHNQLPKIILGVEFTDGIEVVKPKAQAAAA